jgi:hypothetical protein
MRKFFLRDGKSGLATLGAALAGAAAVLVVFLGAMVKYLTILVDGFHVGFVRKSVHTYAPSGGGWGFTYLRQIYDTIFFCAVKQSMAAWPSTLDSGGNGFLGTSGRRQVMNPSVMNLQHRSVLELSVGLSRLIKGRHNGGVVYFGGSSKHCQYYLADHTLY